MDDKEKIVKQYTNGEVTVVWKPDMCIHSAICFKGLSKVFDPRRRPWIEMEGADTQTIIFQVRKCPSGAISFFMNTDGEQPEKELPEAIIEIVDKGPVLLKGNIKIKYKGGTIIAKNPALCRCGASKNKPYCDGAHRSVEFEG